MTDRTIEQQVLDLINAQQKQPVNLRLKDGGAIFNALVHGISAQNLNMTVQYIDVASGQERTVAASRIVSIETPAPQDSDTGGKEDE